MLERDVAAGIHRVEDAHTNWYLVEDGDRLLVVDAGVPPSWDSLHDALRELGSAPEQIAAIVLTHAHFDHIGFAERARAAYDVPVWVHENDVPLTRHPMQYAHERSRLRYPARYPRARPILAELTKARAFFPPPLKEVRRYGHEPGDGDPPLPASPRIVFTPGHTLGHCALHFPERDAVIAGDAIVMLDPYTGETGPRIVAGAATADRDRAFDSLDPLAETGARIVLTGHGPAWTEGVEAACERARAAGFR